MTLATARPLLRLAPMQRSESMRRSKGYRRLIPSMNALLVFEAAARLGSFTVAAQELGVTQAAVSKQIRFLEELLDTRLFHRLHRAIQLTPEGSALFLVTGDSLQRIAATFDKILDGQAEHEIVLACTSAFSHLRIMPRLPALQALLPDLQLRLVPPLHREADLAIRYGNGSWDDGTATLLFDEEVFPVCAPEWLASHAAPRSIADLYQSPLIDSDATLEGWMTWSTWFRALDHTPPRLRIGLRCTHYADTIRAATQGMGIALGWNRLTAPLLADGQLIRVTDFIVKPRDAYYLVTPHGRKLVAGDPLIAWLREEPAVCRPL